MKSMILDFYYLYKTNRLANLSFPILISKYLEMHPSKHHEAFMNDHYFHFLEIKDNLTTKYKNTTAFNQGELLKLLALMSLHPHFIF